ncbi:hypothetical protein WJ60_06410 [Burkholderia ubonensis]|uniref:type III secretion apparatus protein OrgA/MxiK n=1 Tax=Burkholderia ubonensis TaxID=101571 RepID=UPI000756568E|nr:type III secretion apparatus protein OrgA/MxiK [Burkholderia ubonensis]KVM73939.1 hypothetical protein WJ60_06410 [Burkholderia ubonensis]
MNPIQLLNIMYAPCSFAHREHRMLGELDLDRLPARVANQMLIDHYRLDTRIDFDVTSPPQTRQCIEHWPRLPRVCFLMGIQCLRASLIEHARYLHLDAASQRFFQMPMLTHPDRSSLRASPPDELDIQCAGAKCLAAVARPLPHALKARIPLLFPKILEPDLRERLHGRVTEPVGWQLPLFLFALTYAGVEHAPLP